jgi:hypothetical protein
MQSFNETNCWFFEKIKRLTNPGKMTEMQREKTQISKVRNEKEEITTNSKKIQVIIREYFDNLYSNKLENIEKK